METQHSFSLMLSQHPSSSLGWHCHQRASSLKSTGIPVKGAKGEGLCLLPSGRDAFQSFRLFALARAICHQVIRWHSWECLALTNNSATAMWLCAEAESSSDQSDMLVAAV